MEENDPRYCARDAKGTRVCYKYVVPVGYPYLKTAKGGLGHYKAATKHGGHHGHEMRAFDKGKASGHCDDCLFQLAKKKGYVTDLRYLPVDPCFGSRNLGIFGKRLGCPVPMEAAEDEVTDHDLPVIILRRGLFSIESAALHSPGLNSHSRVLKAYCFAIP